MAGYRVGIRYVLGHTCSLSNPVTLIFLPNTQMTVHTSTFMHTHSHTLLPVRKQTHKGSKRERCKVQSEVEGRRREAGQTAEEERVLQKGGNPELDALAVVLLRDGWRTRDTRSQER